MMKSNYVSYLNSKSKPIFGTLITTKYMLNLKHKKDFLMINVFWAQILYKVCVVHQIGKKYCYLNIKWSAGNFVN